MNLSRSSLLAFGATALLGGCMASDAGRAGDLGGAPAPCPETRGWSAFVNAMPGPGARPTLIVTGEVRVDETALATLTPGMTDRMMPPGQRFTLSVHGGGSAKAARWTPIRGELRPALNNYREVIIGCGGAVVVRISDVEVTY